MRHPVDKHKDFVAIAEMNPILCREMAMHPSSGVDTSLPSLRRLFGVALLVCLFGAVMATVLTRAKLNQGLVSIVEARVLASGRSLAHSIERAQGIGLDLAQLEGLPDLLRRHRGDPLITAIDVFDADGRVVSSSEPGRRGTAIDPEVRRTAQAAGDAPWSTSSGERRVAGLNLRTGYGLVIGHLGLQYARSELAQVLDVADRRLAGRAIACFGAAAILSILGLAVIRRRPAADLRWRVATACLVPLTLAMAAFGYSAQHIFSAQLTPQAVRKAEALGAGLAGLIERAGESGFDYHALYGVDAALRELRAGNPEIAQAAALDADGAVLYRDGVAPDRGDTPAGRAEVALLRDGVRYGSLRFDIDPHFGRGLIRDMGLDVAVVLLVALVLASELMRHAGGSAAAHAAELPRVRAPLFTFMLAEELTRPCLPGYVARVAGDTGATLAPLVVGLPIAIFMLIVALGQPGFGRWSRRVGRRSALLAGAAIGAAGFVGTALAHGLIELIAWRAVCAFGYAIVFAAAQGYVLDHAGAEGRTRGFAVFVGAIMAATVCGPSIGGILADQFGPRATFAVSALLCLLALAPAWAMPRAAAAGPGEDRPAGGPGGLAQMLRNRRFAVLTLFAAIPAKVLLIGVLFYLVPLYVAQLGHGQAVAGRLIMGYGLSMVVLVPLAAGRGRTAGRRLALVVAGLALASTGGLLLAAMPDLAGLAALVALLGLGQALSISAQAALVADVCSDDIAVRGQDGVYGAYRMLERLGNAAGPLVAGALLAAIGFVGAFVALGLVGVLCALVLWAALGASVSSAGEVRHALR